MKERTRADRRGPCARAIKNGGEMDLIVDNEHKEMEFSGTLSDLLRELRVMREEVVVKVNGRLAPETRKIGKKDKVEIIKVVFGG